MKKVFGRYLQFFFVFIGLLCTGVFSSCCLKKNEQHAVQQLPEHRAFLLITERGRPTAATLSLLAALNLAHDGTLQNIVEVTQKDLLRPTGKERWQAPESVYEEQRDKIIPMLKQLGLFQEIRAQKKDYRYAVLLGATVTRVRKRLAFLIHEWNRGIRFDQIVMLCGQRLLDPELESSVVLYDRENSILPIKQSWHEPEVSPKTETEMMRMVFEQAQLPEALAQVPCIFVDTPMQKSADGTMRRPTTGDTVNAWLAQNPVQGSCLVVSCQPYVTYQDSVMRSLMPKSFAIETVGLAAKESEGLAVLLDTVARILYQENQRFMTSKF